MSINDYFHINAHELEMARVPINTGNTVKFNWMVQFESMHEPIKSMNEKLFIARTQMSSSFFEVTESSHIDIHHMNVNISRKRWIDLLPLPFSTQCVRSQFEELLYIRNFKTNTINQMQNTTTTNPEQQVNSHSYS